MSSIMAKTLNHQNLPVGLVIVFLQAVANPDVSCGKYEPPVDIITDKLK